MQLSPIKKHALSIIAFFIIGFAITNFVLLGKDMILGDGSGEGIFPTPLYGITRLPERPNTIEYNGIDRMALDFAQIYFISKDIQSLSQNYDTGYLDPWNRPSRYSPVVHFICAATICKFDYGQSSFAHIIIQSLLFFIIFLMIFKQLNIQHLSKFAFVVGVALIFLTPAGLAWMERGQFSLYVAIAYLLITAGSIFNKPLLIIGSIFFAYIKWTSFPFIFLVLGLYWLDSKNNKDRIQRAAIMAVCAFIILILSLAFRSRFIHFINGLYIQELLAQPEGISITYFLPQIVKKWSPIILLFIGAIYILIGKTPLTDLIPFITGAGVFFTIYPTIAHEYSIPSLIFAIPFLLFNIKENNGKLNKVIALFFILFIFVASLINQQTGFISGPGLGKIFLVVSIIFIILPFVLLKYKRRSGNELSYVL